MSIKEKILEDVSVKDKMEDLKEIILYNDEVNTFDHVIEMLIEACNHTPQQAEQCSIIVHFNGKCAVKTGTYDDLEPRCSILLEAGLSAEIV